MTRWRLAIRLLIRDGRSGELSLLLAALFLAVTAATTVNLLADRLNRTTRMQAAELLGADLSVSGHQPFAEAWYRRAAELGLQSTESVEFSSVLVENDELLLVGVKAVPDPYPLRGTLKISSSLGGEALPAHGPPEPGTVWVEPRVLAQLGLDLNDPLTVGEKALRITRLILHEPDRRGDLYSLSPRVLINRADLEATRVIQPGSHLHYYALFSGQPPPLSRFKQWLKPQLQAGQRITDIEEDRPELGNAIRRSEQYLGLTSIAVVLIAGVAIAMSARRHGERHHDLIALLKCLGASQRDILAIIGYQFLIVGLTATTAGCLAGGLLQILMVRQLAPLLPQSLVEPGLAAWLQGGASGLLILFGFSLPNLLRLQRLTPLRVIRRDLQPLPASSWAIYGLVLFTLLVLLWRYTQDLQTTAAIVGVGAAGLATFALLSGGMLRLTRSLAGHSSPAIRLGLNHLTRQPRLGVVQILAFSTTLIAMQLLLLIRTELVQDWQKQLPQNAPNHFALNLFDGDLSAFEQFLSRGQIDSSAFYPVVRGRLTHARGQEIHTLIKRDASLESSLNRELSLTWSATLPPDNPIRSGRWEGQGSAPGVSVEQELARRMGIHPGDSLTFQIAGRPLTVPVTSTRSVRWDSMRPNFFMIFPPGILESYPHTWLTSFYLPPEKSSLLPAMARAFPGITLLDVGKLLGQFQAILEQVTLAAGFVLILALIAGFTVLFATVRMTLDERLHEDTLLRALGARSRLLRLAQWVEFASLGILSGLLATIISELGAWMIYERVFGLTYHFHWASLWMTPLLAAMVIGLSGYWATRPVVRESPMRLLRS